MKKLLLASASLLMCSGIASAQTDGLVSVDIQDVLQDIAVDLNIDESSIPVTVQLPVSVAANVCDVDVNALSVEVDAGETNCTAVTGSQELTQVVQQEIASGGSTDDQDAAANDDGTDDTTDTADDGTVEDTDDTASDDTNQDDPTEDTASQDDDSSTDEDVADTGDDTDDTTTSSTKSAREFAPGRSDNPAPGQTENPQANAPGQLKTECPAGTECE